MSLLISLFGEDKENYTFNNLEVYFFGHGYGSSLFAKSYPW
jgi:hypothetical protein